MRQSRILQEKQCSLLFSLVLGKGRGECLNAGNNLGISVSELAGNAASFLEFKEKTRPLFSFSLSPLFLSALSHGERTVFFNPLSTFLQLYFYTIETVTIASRDAADEEEEEKGACSHRSSRTLLPTETPLALHI